MKILVIGKNAREEILIEKLAKSNKVEKIFCAPANPSIGNLAECININLDDITSFVHFVKENNIDLTITMNEYVISKGIADVFKSENLNIFAPLVQSALVSMNKINLKKFLSIYDIPTPYYKIFDKEQAALEYAKNANYPVLIKVPDLLEDDTFYCETFLQARKQIIKLLNEDNKYIIIEDFINGDTITLPIISDGYNVLPLPYAYSYKRTLDGNGGDYTKPIGAYAPYNKIHEQLEEYIAKNIIFRFLDALQVNNLNYCGFLSFDFVICENNIFITDVIPTIDNVIATTILPLVEDDIADIIFTTLNGALGDIYPSIKQNDKTSLSVSLNSLNEKTKIITGIEDINNDNINVYYNETAMSHNFDIVSIGKRPIILNSNASTLSNARQNLYDEIGAINFDGIHYRRDIGNVNCPFM